MKQLKYTAIILFSGLLLVACGNESKTSKNKSKNATETVKKPTKTSKEKARAKEKEVAKNILETLKHKTPLTKAQFESWLPQSLIGFTQTSSTINLLPKRSMCDAIYKTTDKEIYLKVIDGAGDKASYYIEPYVTMNIDDFNSEDNYGYDKSKIIHGIKLREAYRKTDGGTYNVITFFNNRYAISVIAKKISHEDLENIIKELNLKELPN